jgi:HAE1 family hydrophobic/amphiphilic exporter-1
MIRLRPILMTSLSLIFGLLPLALAIGPGAELRSGIAQAVIGGMVSSTLLTMVVIPVVFSLLDDLTKGVGVLIKGRQEVADAGTD